MSFSHGTSTANPLAVPHTQNTAPVLEFRCLFTADLRRKQKRWQDGKLKFHTHNNRVMVYDEKANFVGDSHWREEFPLGEGEELQLERGGILVEVGECVGKTDQDLTELVDKRIKEKEDRAAAKAAKGTPLRAPPNRTDGTPGLYPQPKPLNALLTPSGHYGRAMMPTTSPFEDRQKLARGNTEEKEDNRPSKRQRADAPSKNGYAQNLMGATLSLSSSRPPSSAPIRYEPMKVTTVPRPDPVDLTLDDDDEDMTQRSRGTAGGQEGKQEQRNSKVVQKRTRKLPPPKSTYAGNLTGASLNLSMPAVRRDVRLPKPKATKMSRPIELESSSSEAQSEEDTPPQKKAQTVSEITSKTPKPSDRGPLPIDASEKKIPPLKKALAKAHVDPKKSKTSKRTPFPMNSSEEESENEVHSSKNAQSTSSIKGKQVTNRHSSPLKNSDGNQPAKGASPKAKTVTKVLKSSGRKSRSISPGQGLWNEVQLAKKSSVISKALEGTKATKRDSTPLQSPGEEVQPRKKSRTTSITTKISKPSKRDFSPLARSSSPIQRELLAPIPKQNKTVLTPSAGSSLANSIGPEQAVSSLRIKSKPRRMMMFMDRPNTRTSSDLSTRNKVATKPPLHLQDQADEIVMSQDTMQLNAFVQKQEAKLQARLNKTKRSRLEANPSSSPVDNGIDHHTIDLLLSRKSIQIVRNEPPKNAMPKSQEPQEHPKQHDSPPQITIPRPKTRPVSAIIPATNDFDLSSSSPESETADFNIKAMPPAATIYATNDSNLASSPIIVDRFTASRTKDDETRSERLSHNQRGTNHPAKPVTTLQPDDDFQLENTAANRKYRTQEAPAKPQSPAAFPAVSCNSNDNTGKECVEKAVSKEPIILEVVPRSPQRGSDERHSSTSIIREASTEITLGQTTKRTATPAHMPTEPETATISPVLKPHDMGIFSPSMPLNQPKEQDVGPSSKLNLDDVLDELAKTAVLPKVQPAAMGHRQEPEGSKARSSVSKTPARKPPSPPSLSGNSASEGSVSPTPEDFLPPKSNGAIQYATAHFRSIMKSPASQTTGEARLLGLNPDAQVGERRVVLEKPFAKKQIIKPSPKSSPITPDELRPGQGTLEAAESTPVISMTDIPIAALPMPVANTLPLQPIKPKVANPATTKGKGKSLQELAASTTNANEIQTPSSLGAGSGIGLGFNVMPPPAAPAPPPQISRTSAAAGIGNNIAKRIYPAAPPPRVSNARANQDRNDQVGGGWEGRVLILGGKSRNAEDVSQKKKSGVGVKDGPWSREAFDLFGEWVRPG